MQMITLLRETRSCLQHPGNDFTWSRWDDSKHALKDFDDYILSLETGLPTDPSELSMLFGPTGSIQEVSLSSGWGTEFLTLAERFDELAKNIFGTL